jgi:hypothetical protein
LDSRRTKRGWIQYDIDEGGDLDSERSVVVGRRRSKESDNQVYYILIIKHRGVENEYERVGIGMDQKAYVSRQMPVVRVL